MENHVRALRKELGLSQEELGKRCGVSRQTINAIENQKYDPSLPLAFQLARILGTTVDALFLPKLDASEERSRCLSGAPRGYSVSC